LHRKPAFLRHDLGLIILIGRYIADMAKQDVNDDEKHPPAEPEGAAQGRGAREPGQPLGHGSEFSSSDAEKRQIPDATRTVTQTTTASEIALEAQIPNSAGKKPWYQNLNPLKRGKATPVPAARSVSREHGASFLSMLTFHWMAPVMKVRPIRFRVVLLGKNLKKANR
jgi:hypothetical protein